MTINRDMDDGSDLDEPMASQSADSEAPLTHNSSKSNFFPGEEEKGFFFFFVKAPYFTLCAELLGGNSSGSGDERSGMLGSSSRGSFKVGISNGTV